MDPRRPPLGALVAAIALVGAIALLLAALVEAPPFGSVAGPTPTASPTASLTARPSASPSPVASPTPLSAERVMEILGRIERRMTEIRELTARRPPVARLVTSAQATRLLIADFRSENPADVLADQAQVYRALGLLERTDELGPIFERFLSTQVLGFYRTDDRSLYVISDQGFGALERVTAAHEYTHALQDEHFGLDALSPEGHDRGDLSLARLSLVEGDATLAMFQWAVAELTPEDLAELLTQAGDPAAREALESAPPIVRETAMLPYVQGLEFVQRAWLEGGWTAVGRLWRQPPSTTEQVLHPEKYEAREGALAVRLPDGVAEGLGDSWRLAFKDTHGELVTRVWAETAVPWDRALGAAAGWGGDRVGLYRGPDDAWAVVWVTRWDGETDADEFAAAARSAAAELGPAKVTADGRSDASVTVALASDEAVLDRLVALLP